MSDSIERIWRQARGAALACGLGIFLLACSSEDAPAAPVADEATVKRIAQGELIGTTTPQGAHAWLGIPFAAAPTADLRWRAPREGDTSKSI